MQLVSLARRLPLTLSGIAAWSRPPSFLGASEWKRTSSRSIIGRSWKQGSCRDGPSRDDEVARGYQEVNPLSDEELRCLDDLWRASVLRYALRLLESESITGEAVSELEWRVAQLEKTRPFQS